MPGSFALERLHSVRFEAVCFSLDAARPEEYFGLVEQGLRELGVEGDVLLDLLACNGATSRRFFAMAFDGSRLDHRSLRHEPEPGMDAQALAHCRDYYAKRAGGLENSVLSAAAMRAIRSI